MAAEAKLNRVTQLGVEAANGTAVTATKKIQLIDIQTAVNPTIQSYRGTARRFPVSHKLNTEAGIIKLGGWMNYTEIVYVLSNLYGAATITTPSNGVLTRKWVWSVPLSGSLTRKTWTIEEGSSVAARRMAYGLLSGWGFKSDREAQIPISGDGVTQIQSDAFSLTGSLSAVAQIPVLGKHGNVYLDTSWGGIGGTQIVKPMSTEWKTSKEVDTYWTMNRSNASYAEHVDTPPDYDLALMVPNDAYAATLDGYYRADSTCYVRVEFVGDLIEAVTPNYFYTLDIDIPCRITKVDADGDQKAVRVRTFHFTPIEDATAGFGTVYTLYTTLTAL